MTSTAQEADVEKLWHLHSGRIYTYVCRWAGPEAAEELVADTFLVAWRRRTEIPANDLPWLLGVARVLCRQHLRVEAARRDTSPLGEWPTIPDPSPGTDTSRDLLSALRGLRAADREVIFLSTWEDLSVVDGAAVLGCSVTAYKVRLHRARQRLRGQLEHPSTHPSTTRKKPV